MLQIDHAVLFQSTQVSRLLVSKSFRMQNSDHTVEVAQLKIPTRAKNL